jgi:hypothetical protein
MARVGHRYRKTCGVTIMGVTGIGAVLILPHCGILCTRIMVLWVFTGSLQQDLPHYFLITSSHSHLLFCYLVLL